MKEQSKVVATQNASENVNAASMAASVEPLNNVSDMKQEELMLEATAELQRDLQEEASKNERAKHEVEISLNGECRMAAFARGINRGVSEKNVLALAKHMKEKGYRKAEVVQVMWAEKAVEMDPKLVLVDQYDELIKKEDAHLYFLVIDGQHRVLAAQMVNNELSEEEQIVVPAVEVELAEGETISQYIYDINSTKEEWSTADYAQSALQAQDSPLLERYAALMKSKSNPEGLTLTVLNRMYCGNKKAISGADFKALCEGRTTKGRKGREVIPAFNLSRGNDILTMCYELGLTNRDVNRELVMDIFQELELKYDREVALETFHYADKDEVKAMRNKRGVLDSERFAAYMREWAVEVDTVAQSEKSKGDKAL